MSIDAELTLSGSQLPVATEGSGEEFDVGGAVAQIAHSLGTLAEAAAAAEGDAEFRDRTNEVFRLKRDPETFEVKVECDVTLEEYKAITPPRVWALLEKWAEPLRGKTAVFVNPTMEGGGVAMLRPTIVHLFNMLGIKAHWFVMAGPPKEWLEGDDPVGDPFDYTKLMHNISQRQGGDARITEEGKALHKRWAMLNWEVLKKQAPIQNADFMVFDDPQPVPFLEDFKELNPGAIVGWRNHIDTDTDLKEDPTTPQGEVAGYLLDECGVTKVDFAMVHPHIGFVHKRLADKSYLGPATIDPFDNLNRHLTEEGVVEGITFVNGEIAAKNAELIAAGRHEDVQELLSMDPETLRITLVARFDESKGMDKAMEMGVRTKRLIRKKWLAQGMPEDEVAKKIDKVEIVIVGNGSKDDPSGKPMYEKMLRLRRERYPEDAKNIIIMRLKHNYDAMNALMCRTKVLMQTSDAEGCETRISDGRKHGLPVVISSAGAMYTQIPLAYRKGAKSAYILDYSRPDYDLDNGAEFMANLLTDKQAYEEAAQEALEQGRDYNQVEFGTISNAVRWLRIMNREYSKRELRRQGQKAKADKIKADKMWLMSEMIKKEEDDAQATGALALAGA